MLHYQPPALLVAEIKFRDGCRFGRLLIRRVNRPEVLPALSDNRDAPASQLGSDALLSRGLLPFCYPIRRHATERGGMTAWLRARLSPKTLIK